MKRALLARPRVCIAMLMAFAPVLLTAQQRPAAKSSTPPNRYAMQMQDALHLTPFQYDSMARIYNFYEDHSRPIKDWLETHARGHEDQPPYRDSVARILHLRATADTAFNRLLTPKQRRLRDSVAKSRRQPG